MLPRAPHCFPWGATGCCTPRGVTPRSTETKGTWGSSKSLFTPSLLSQPWGAPAYGPLQNQGIWPRSCLHPCCEHPSHALPGGVQHAPVPVCVGLVHTKGSQKFPPETGF